MKNTIMDKLCIQRLQHANNSIERKILNFAYNQPIGDYFLHEINNLQCALKEYRDDPDYRYKYDSAIHYLFYEYCKCIMAVSPNSLPVYEPEFDKDCVKEGRVNYIIYKGEISRDRDGTNGKTKSQYTKEKK